MLCNIFVITDIRKLFGANEDLLGEFLWQDRHGSILCADVCRNLYCQFMSFLYALTLQNACHESACEGIACTHCISHFHLRSLYKRNFARGEHIAAVYTAGKNEHLQIVLAQQEPAFILQVDARIAKDATYRNQLFIVDFEDVASLDAIGDNLLGIESLTEIDIEDFEDSFSLRHVVEEAVDSVTGNLVALSQ